SRLQFIISGQDLNPAYKDALLKRNFTIFYQEMSQPNFRQQLKKIDDIVISFLKTAQIELRQARLPQNKSWQNEVNEQVSIFAEILSQCLQSKECVNYCTPELLARLEIFHSKTPQQPTQTPL